MRPLPRLLATTALAATLPATSALADVTASDVWTNIRAYIDAFGPEVTVETSRSGDTLSVSDMTLAWTLPFDAGRISFGQTGFDLTEQGDGTVAISYKSDIKVWIDAQITGEGDFRMALDIVPEGFEMTASGDPGAVTYVYALENATLRSTEFVTPEPVNMEIEGTLTGMSGEVTMTSAAQITVEGSGRMDSMAIEFQGGENGVSFVQGTESGPSVNQIRVVLPKGGMDIMNLAAAFERGLSYDISSQIAGYSTRQVMEGPQGVLSDQRTEAGSYEIEIKLDRTGARIAADVTEIDSRVNMPAVLPLPVEIKAARGYGAFQLPISAGEALQDIEYSITAEGLTVNEPLWSMIDPGGLLPRDPATLRLGLTGKVKSFVDVFNFADFAARMDAGDVPGEVHEVTLTELELAVAGARVAGSGAVSLDNEDLATYGGFPKPTGSFDFLVQGANGMMDNLVKLGLLKDQDVMGARMMMGMVTKPDPGAGTDALRSRIELTGEGHILANGMRLK